MKSFPERLIDIQNRKRLNDSELAEKGGIKPPSLSKILKGTTKDPGISFFSNLVLNLKLSPEETYLLITGKAYQSDEKSKDQRIAELEQRLQTAEELNKSLSKSVENLSTIYKAQLVLTPVGKEENIEGASNPPNTGQLKPSPQCG